MKPAKRTEYISSAIRGAIYEESLKMAKEGIDVLKLNSGNLALFGFTMPESVRQAILKNVDRATGYCPYKGMPEAIDAIYRYHKEKGLSTLNESDIFIGNGVCELAETLMLALVNDGDEVLLPSPTYSLWSNSVLLAGGKPVYYMLDEEQNWFPDLADIRKKITARTKAIVLINPNNPTGVLYPKQVLLDVAEIARKHDLTVVSDEIYDRLVMDGKTHVSFAAAAPDLPVITMNGLSKSHVICGLRCGWMALSSSGGKIKPLSDAISRLMSMRICGNTVSQLVIPAAVGDPESTAALLAPGGRLYEQRKVVMDTLNSSGVISCTPNDAAFYVFPKFDIKKTKFRSDAEFCFGLLHEKHIMVVAGSGFMYPDNNHFRIVMLPEAGVLKKATEDMVDFVRSSMI